MKITIPLKHPIESQQLFLSLCSQLNFNKVEAINRAKRKYKHRHFQDLTDEEVKDLIEKLRTKIATQPLVIEYLVYNISARKIYKVRTLTCDKGSGMKFVTCEDEPTKETFDLTDGDIDLLPYTNKKDYLGNKIYKLDVFIDKQNELWMTEWSNRYFAWVGYSMSTGIERLLFTFTIIRRIGSIYEDINIGKEVTEYKK